MAKIGHISASQINCLLQCGESYRRKYIMREMLPPTISLIRGLAGHKMIEKNNKQKLITKTDMPADELKTHAAYEVEQFFAGELMLKSDELERGVNVVKGETIDSVVSTIDKFLEFNRDIQPIEVEAAQDIVLSDDVRIRYVMDIEIEGGIIDYKFTGKPKTQRAIDEDTGLTIYTLAYFAKHQKMPEKIRFHNFVSRYTPKKRELKTDGLILNTSRTARDFEVMVDRINMAIRAIQNDVFLPAPVGAWNCAPEWCGYFSTCPFINYERVCAAQSQEEKE